MSKYRTEVNSETDTVWKSQVKWVKEVAEVLDIKSSPY